MNIKKIAVIHNLPPGGGVRHLSSVVDTLSRMGYQVDQFRFESSSANSDSKFKNTTVFPDIGKSKIPFINILLGFKRIINYSKIVNSNKYDLVIFGQDWIYKSPPLFSIIRSYKLYICHEPPREYIEPIIYHSPRLNNLLFNLVNIPIAIIDWLNVRTANTIVANSMHSQKIIHKYYGMKPLVLYPRVDSSVFFGNEQINKKHQIVSVGSLLPYKGHDLIIKAIKLSKTNIDLVIVGKGSKSDKERIRKLSTELGVSTRIICDLSDKELRELYQSSLMTVSAAFKEPFGLSILESILSGTPVISVDSGGQGEQIENAGIKCHRSPTGISTAIIKILNDYQKFKVNCEKINEYWTLSGLRLDLKEIIKHCEY